MKLPNVVSLDSFTSQWKWQSLAYKVPTSGHHYTHSWLPKFESEFYKSSNNTLSSRH